MKLPIPAPRYEMGRESERNRALEQADQQNHKRGRDIEVNPGRLIVTSPDGTRWKIVVDDLGTVTAEAI